MPYSKKSKRKSIYQSPILVSYESGAVMNMDNALTDSEYSRSPGAAIRVLFPNINIIYIDPTYSARSRRVITRSLLQHISPNNRYRLVL